MQIPTHGIIIATALVQWTLTGFTGVKGVASTVIPPAIEGGGYLPEYVTPGDLVLATWTLHKRTDCPGENSRVWNGAGGFHITEPTRPTTLPITATPETYPIPTEIPELAPIGELSLSIVGWYQCPGAAREAFEIGPLTTTVTEPEE